MSLQCSICLCGEEVSQSGWLSVRKCGHVFHRQCLELSLRHAQQCPCCRTKIRQSNKYLLRIFPTLEAETCGGNAGAIGSAQATPAHLAKLQEARESVQRLSCKLTALESQLSIATERSTFLAEQVNENNAELARRQTAVEQYKRRVVDLNVKIEQLGPKYRLATDPSIVSTEVEDRIWQSLVSEDPPEQYYKEMFRIRAAWLCQANNARAKAEHELRRSRLEWEVEKQRLASKIARAEANLARSSTCIADPANCTLPCASASPAVVISDDESDVYIPKLVTPALPCDLAGKAAAGALVGAGPTLASRPPGSFIRKKENVTLNGVETGSKFIVHGPNGIGGTTTCLKNQAYARALPSKRPRGPLSDATLRMEHFFTKRQA